MTDNIWREAVERMAEVAERLLYSGTNPYVAAVPMSIAAEQLRALAALFAERGLELKPLVATDGMAVAVRHLDFASPTDIDWPEGYATMCAAFPNPLKPPTPEAT